MPRWTVVTLSALLSASIGCGDEGASKPNNAAQNGTFGEPPGATSNLNPCAPALVGPGAGSLRPLHEGHGDAPVEVPPEYRSLKNPCQRNPEVIAHGQALFAEHCAKCHGPEGDTKNATRTGLNPAPKDFTVGGYSESYLFWRIQEGGKFAPYNSEMPSFKTLLSHDDAWAVASFVAVLADKKAPAVSPGAKPLPPTLRSIAPMDGALHVLWRLTSSCDTLKLERKKDAGVYGPAYTLVGYLTDQHDTWATGPGKYCYRITCERGAEKSAPSNEQCASP